jgi:hypothetical protein
VTEQPLVRIVSTRELGLDEPVKLVTHNGRVVALVRAGTRFTADLADLLSDLADRQRPNHKPAITVPAQRGGRFLWTREGPSPATGQFLHTTWEAVPGASTQIVYARPAPDGQPIPNARS